MPLVCNEFVVCRNVAKAEDCARWLVRNEFTVGNALNLTPHPYRPEGAAPRRRNLQRLKPILPHWRIVGRECLTP